MSDRCAEQSEDAITERLRNVAFIAMDSIHHELQCRIDDCTCLFRVKSFNQCGRAFEIGKEGSNRLTLTVTDYCCTNPFGQMGRCVTGRKERYRRDIQRRRGRCSITFPYQHL